MRCADSLSIRQFLHYELHEATPWDCAPKFDPVKGSVNATLAGVEALRFEISERGLVAYA